jgi:hypothetical protein
MLVPTKLPVHILVIVGYCLEGVLQSAPARPPAGGLGNSTAPATRGEQAAVTQQQLPAAPLARHPLATLRYGAWSLFWSRGGRRWRAWWWARLKMQRCSRPRRASVWCSVVMCCGIVECVCRQDRELPSFLSMNGRTRRVCVVAVVGQPTQSLFSLVPRGSFENQADAFDV